MNSSAAPSGGSSFFIPEDFSEKKREKSQDFLLTNCISDPEIADNQIPKLRSRNRPLIVEKILAYTGNRCTWYAQTPPTRLETY